MTPNKTIIVVGGGTGGHVFPLLNLIHYLQKNTPSQKSIFSEQTFRWIGEKDSIESRLAKTNHIPFSSIICGKLRRYFSVKTLLLPFQILIGILQSLVIVFDEKPKAIFSKGGYVSLPVAIAGWILRVPVYLHESDSIPGLANRLVARFAVWIWCSFVEADRFFSPEKILGHGTLLSPDIVEILKTPVHTQSKTQLLVSCGSQGSSAIFDVLLGILTTTNKLQLWTVDIHLILGMKNSQYREKFEKFPNVFLYDFFYDQAEYLKIVQKCDIVITRSGSSVFEFEALWLHMILIPHPHTGNNHQYWNALAFEKKWHECILQENLTKELSWVLEKYTNYKKSTDIPPLDLSIYEQISRKLLQ